MSGEQGWMWLDSLAIFAMTHLSVSLLLFHLTFRKKLGMEGFSLTSLLIKISFCLCSLRFFKQWVLNLASRAINIL